ncbi:MAG TPA: GNAT family N-acetyltransferase [Abditibacteriaceae bacterium]|jgi:tagatose 1,6-diphosphate aldolase|nr:GNAT family N-acetyltransferase [Abditibacteriaceae bacterium]
MNKGIEGVSSLIKRALSRQTGCEPGDENHFQFLDPGVLIDDDLQLVLAQTANAQHTRGWAPHYIFQMVHVQDRARMGSISLRIGDTPFLTMYAGQIGYGVEPAFRGHRYAARSVQLLLPLAHRHNLNPLWITCNPDNWASRKSCEIAGAQLVEIVDLPVNCDMYRGGERRKCRYRIEL